MNDAPLGNFSGNAGNEKKTDPGFGCFVIATALMLCTLAAAGIAAFAFWLTH